MCKIYVKKNGKNFKKIKKGVVVVVPHTRGLITLSARQAHTLKGVGLPRKKTEIKTQSQ